MSTPQDAFNAIPFLTRYYLAGVIGVKLLSVLNMIGLGKLVLNFPLVIYKFQIWRLFTNHLILGNGFGLIISLIHIYKYGGELERGHFKGNAVEYSFVLFFCALLETIIGYFLELQVLSFSTVFVMMYIWSRANSTNDVNFMGILTFKAPYIPWVFVVFDMIMGSDPTLDLVGIFCGHVYWFTADFVPKKYGVRYFRVPTFWYVLWGERPPSTNPDIGGQRTIFGNHDWGRGARLQ
eukprot:c16833_g1_i1.p1 GENE.c16833_g1_i1~~c16833_g1_i1.p1  ORF type:complete len:243 (-),score=33.33 c16833_g1_i1:28-735(-)